MPAVHIYVDLTLFETLLDIVTAHYVTVLPTSYNTATEERSDIMSVLNVLEICYLFYLVIYLTIQSTH